MCRLVLLPLVWLLRRKLFVRQAGWPSVLTTCILDDVLESTTRLEYLCRSEAVSCGSHLSVSVLPPVLQTQLNLLHITMALRCSVVALMGLIGVLTVVASLLIWYFLSRSAYQAVVDVVERERHSILSHMLDTLTTELDMLLIADNIAIQYHYRGRFNLTDFQRMATYLLPACDMFNGSASYYIGTVVGTFAQVLLGACPGGQGAGVTGPWGLTLQPPRG